MTAKVLTLQIGMEDAMRQEAVDGFLAECRPWVFRLALKITGNLEAAEDATQEALLRASKSRAKLAGASNPEAWLRKVAVRCAIDRIEEELPQLQEAPANIEDPAEFLAVQQVLARLSLDHRTVLALSLGEGLSYRELAETLGIPEGTVASRLNAAKTAFQKEWEK